MAQDNRDTVVDRLLRRTLRPGEGMLETDACLDAETLAAFADGSLTREGRAAAEAHAADCARCLQLLAAIARTDEAVAPPRAWRMPVMFRWAVPLAAAATAVAIWVNVDQDRPHDDVPLPATVSTVPSDTTRARESERSGPESAAKDTVQPGAPAVGERRQARSGADEESFRAKAVEKKVEEKRETLPRRDAPAATPAATPVPAPATPATAPSATPPAAMAERPLADRRNESAARPLQVRALPPMEVVSPDSLHRWRATGRVVQHSTDGGSTWSTQAVPLQSEVLAGSSPSPNVCWLVGRGGAVLRTADRSTWLRIDFPEVVDLTAVNARNEREAEVTTADGRVFRTTDGGRNWSLQETSSPSF